MATEIKAKKIKPISHFLVGEKGGRGGGRGREWYNARIRKANFSIPLTGDGL